MNINYVNLQRLKILTLQIICTLQTANAKNYASRKHCMYFTVQFRYSANHGNDYPLRTVF